PGGSASTGGNSAPATKVHGNAQPLDLASAVHDGVYDPSKDPIVRVVQEVRPAVVNVTTDLFEQNQFGGSQPGRGVGTGFIIRSDGIIVTNYHVVEHAQRITVITPGTNANDGQSYPARVIGGDQNADLAILK